MGAGQRGGHRIQTFLKYTYIYIYKDSIMKPTKYCLKKGGRGRLRE
jgi:hypothetical protein